MNSAVGCGLGRVHLIDAVDAGGYDEVSLEQAVDHVGPQLDYDLPPRKMDFGMVPHFLSEFADLFGELERVAELLKVECALQTMTIDDLPHLRIELGIQGGQLVALERFLITRTGDAFPVCEITVSHTRGYLLEWFGPLACVIRWKLTEQNTNQALDGRTPAEEIRN